MRTVTRWWGRYEGDMLTQTEDGELLHDPLQMTIYQGRILDVLISGVRVAVRGPSFYGGRIHFTALALPSAVLTRSPICSVSTARAPSGVAIIVPRT